MMVIVLGLYTQVYNSIHILINPVKNNVKRFCVTLQLFSRGMLTYIRLESEKWLYHPPSACRVSYKKYQRFKYFNKDRLNST